MENGTYHWTPNGGDEKPSRSKGPSGKQIGRILTAAVVLVLVLVTGQHLLVHRRRQTSGGGDHLWQGHRGHRRWRPL